MTEDELRAACIKFFADSQGWKVERVNVDSDALAVVVAFAKHHQAVGLREVADEALSELATRCRFCGCSCQENTLQEWT